MDKPTYAAVVGAVVLAVATWFLDWLPSPVVAVLVLAVGVCFCLRYKKALLQQGRGRLLMWAAKNGHPRTVWALAKAGADVNAQTNAENNAKNKDGWGWTALMWAARNGHTEVIRELLKARADVNARDYIDRTALMWAAGNGHTEVIRELLKAGADVNARGYIGWTALMLAARNGQTEAIRELLKAGADIEARDNMDKTAFDYWQCKQKDRPDFQEISDLLRPKKGDG